MKSAPIFLTAFFLLFAAPSAHAIYIVDGNLGDWGINLNAASETIHYLDTNTPTGATVDYVTEDNADVNSGSLNVGPGWTFNNRYDAEAMYIDNDYDYLYIALVTGLPPTEVTYPAGDLFIDVGNYQDPTSALYDDKKYAFGIDISDGKLYEAQSWEDVQYAAHSESTPWKIGAARSLVGDVDFIYDSINQYSHYVMEAKIPLAYLGLDSLSDHDIWLHWTMKCGNDNLNLHGDIDGSTAVPEPATMALMGMGLAFGFTQRRKKA